VGALLVAQIAVGIAALDLDRAALNARLLALAEFVDGHLHAVVLGPARVHAHQHQSPVLGIGAAGACIDADHGALLVVRAAEQTLELPAIQIGAQGLQTLVGLLQQISVGLQLVELQGGLGIGHSPTPTPQLLQLALHLIELAHLGLGLLLVVPEVGLGGQLLEILLPGVQCRDVKDSPGHGPGGR
jgi:hypothetical protein